MAAQKGESFLLKSGAVGAGVTIGGMNVTNFSLNNQPVDVTTKESGLARTLLSAAGVQSLTFSGSGIFTDTAGEETLRSNAAAGTLNTYHIISGNGDTWEASFLVTAYERSGDHADKEGFSATFESSGAITYTAA